MNAQRLHLAAPSIVISLHIGRGLIRLLREAMSTTRKIPFTLPFTLIFALLLSPIVVAENLVGAKSPETFLVETAGKQAAKLLLGKAADKIFGNKMDEMASELTGKMDKMEENIINTIKNQTKTILKAVGEDTITTHLGAIRDGKYNLKAAINGVERDLKEKGFTIYHGELQKVIDLSDTYSQALDDDIKIGIPKNQHWNGFWRSFVPYVSNKAIYASFIIERWQAEVRADMIKDNEKRAIKVVKTNILNLEAIYEHLEKHVPTMPISAGSAPYQQNLNCVIRTDPDTQLVTSKGEFIRRYAGYDDVADHLPSVTNVWRMWGYCRGDKSNKPPVYYGWANTNYLWSAGKHVGPTDDINECRLISTFGTCQVKGFKYGCTMTPNSDPKHNKWYQGPEPEGTGATTYDTNEIGNKHGHTLYTKFLWNEEPKVLDGSPAHMGQGPNAGKWDKSSLTGQGTFVNYLRTWENTVCAMGPDGKQISQEFPNAPALPHLPTEYLTSTPGSYPKNITDSLPLTIIKTKTPAGAKSLTNRDADTSAAYYFIKRNHSNKTAELSKPYQSEMSAAHDRSLHYFTEFTDEGLPTAYCQVAAIVSLNDSLLNALKANPGLVDAGMISSEGARASQISYKLGITKENASRYCHESLSNHIVASLNDQITKASMEVNDHMIRSCLRLAAINEWVSNPSHSVPSAGQHHDLTHEIRAACNAHRVIPPTIKN